MKPRHEARTPESGPPSPHRRRRNKASRWFPVIVFGVIAVMLIRTRVPAVDDWVTRVLTPKKWEAITNCIDAAKMQVSNRAFARIKNRGYIYQTESGYLVNEVEIGTMGADSGETTTVFSCYLDSNRKVVRLDRGT